MARLSMKLPYSKIIVYDEEYYIQFKVIEKECKTECLIFIKDDDNSYPLFVRGVSKCVPKDIIHFDINTGKRIAFENAMIKLEASTDKMIESLANGTRERYRYFKSQLTRKCFKSVQFIL